MILLIDLLFIIGIKQFTFSIPELPVLKTNKLLLLRSETESMYL